MLVVSNYCHEHNTPFQTVLLVIYEKSIRNMKKIFTYDIIIDTEKGGGNIMNEQAILQAIFELSDQLKNVEERLTKRFQKLETRMDKLEIRMDKLEIRMDKLEGRMNNLEGRMDNLEARVDSLEGRVDSVEITLKEAISKVDAKVTVLASDIVSTKADIKLLQQSK